MLFYWMLGCAPDFGTCDDCCTYGSCDASIQLHNDIAVDFAYIESGDDPLGRYSIRQGFYAMTTEVTQGMFTSLMDYSSDDGFAPTYGQGINHPAYYVNWHMAASFANRLTEWHNQTYDTTLAKCYQCANESDTSVQCTHKVSPYACPGYRLPTDIEWEYMARSGTNSDFWTGHGEQAGGMADAEACSTNVNILDGSETAVLSDFSWFCYTTETHPVAELRPNGFGLYDIHGNVWEWTNDDFGCSFPETIYEHHCQEQSDTRVGRGGSFTLFPYYLTSDGRFEAQATRRDHSIGFRLVRLANHP